MPLARACIVKGCNGVSRDGGPRCPKHPKRKRNNPESERAREKRRAPNRMGGGVPHHVYYDAQWRKLSRELRQAQPWCSQCLTPDGLTVDHPTLAVLCRSCHSRLEAQRRAQGKVS